MAACRLCLLENNDEVSFYNLFQPFDTFPLSTETLAKSIMECVPIQIILEDGLPDKMCSNCMNTLKLIKKFRNMCLQSDAILRKKSSCGDDNISNDCENKAVVANLSPINSPAISDDEAPERSKSPKPQESTRCKICKKEFKRKYNLLCHLRVHNGQRPFVCKVCDVAFKYGSNLRSHMLKVHNTSKESKELYQKHRCKLCHRSFKKMCHLTSHMRIHNVNQPYKCEFCKTSYRYSESLKLHLSQIHCDSDSTCIESEDHSTFKCEICLENFTTKLLYNDHKRMHESSINALPTKTNGYFKCKVCKKDLKGMTGLINHLRIHTGERPFICDICGKTFTQLGPLTVHRRIHTGEKPFKCDICGKSATTRSELRSHLKTHSDKYTYKCEICSKVFKWNSNYLKHKRMHSGIRSHQCNFCQKTFLETADLKKHTRLHLGTQPFKCDICDRQFNSTSNLNRHSQTHL